jgi:hypothetical protein
VYSAADFEYEGASIGVTGTETVITGIQATDFEPGTVDYFSQPFGSGTWDIEAIAGNCC